jgi:tRNA-dihydrouridine synthase A
MDQQQRTDRMDLNQHARLSVAPMMDWTDRHCRYLHRLMSREVLLYTEMVTSPALIRGGALHLLAHNTAEHPVALQLGGSDPTELARITAMMKSTLMSAAPVIGCNRAALGLC